MKKNVSGIMVSGLVIFITKQGLHGNKTMIKCELFNIGSNQETHM